MQVSDQNTEALVNQNITHISWFWVSQPTLSADNGSTTLPPVSPQPYPSATQPSAVDLLRPLRRWIDAIEVRDRKLAHRLCQLIPAQCPFERDINVFGRKLLHIPPLCKLNPLYNEVVGLRFRALCYLADVCGEDISAYC